MIFKLSFFLIYFLIYYFESLLLSNTICPGTTSRSYLPAQYILLHGGASYVQIKAMHDRSQYRKKEC